MPENEQFEIEPGIDVQTVEPIMSTRITSCTFNMAESEKVADPPTDTMRKKSESEQKPSNQNDEDSESMEEQPLDIGEQYLVRRSDDSWRKFHSHNLTALFTCFEFSRSRRNNTN